MIDLNALQLSGGRASLLEVLAAVSDPRNKRGIRHQIAATLTMVAAAGLSGCGRSFRSVGDFVADLPQEALARLGARYHQVRRCYIAPDEATIHRHVKMIDANQADAAAALTMVALDGKVLKGAWEELPDVKVKLFSALVHARASSSASARSPTTPPRSPRYCR